MAEGTGVLEKVVVPELGESILEATVSRWLKVEGDRVSSGEPIVELETEKVNLEVSAQRSGVLVRILHPEGDDVQVGDALAEIGPAGEQDGPRAQEQPAPASEAKAPETAPSRSSQAAQPASQNGGEQEEEPVTARPAGEAPAVTPVAERLIREQGVDVSQVRGSGPGGRVKRADVERLLEERQEEKPVEPSASQQIAPPQAPPQAPPETPPSAPAPAPRPAPQPDQAGGRREERVKMSRRRRTIARRLVEAQQTAAMLTTFNEVDMSAVMSLRASRNEAFQSRYGIKLGITSFFVKAAIGALKAFPLLNAEIQGEEVLIKHYYDIGIAVGASEGLVVPVLRDADRLSFAQIEQRIKEYAQKAEAESLSLEDLRGGTFTITNGGVYGSLLSTPILNPPQVAILGLHKIEKRPIIMGDEMAIRPMMYVALSYDHRIVDGREAVQFLVRVKELVEDPERLLLEG